MARELSLERTAVPGTASAFEAMFKKSRWSETVIQGALFLSAAVSVLTTIGIVYVLGREAWLFFGDARVSILEYLTTAVWQPQIGNFGVWALLGATIITSTIAMVVAIPLGLTAAIYLSEYASPGAREILKPILEILAGIPTVVYGYFALTFMTPVLRALFGTPNVEIYNMASAGIVWAS
jgi:phosphate transport system permease protein